MTAAAVSEGRSIWIFLPLPKNDGCLGVVDMEKYPTAHFFCPERASEQANSVLEQTALPLPWLAHGHVVVSMLHGEFVKRKPGRASGVCISPWMTASSNRLDMVSKVMPCHAMPWARGICSRRVKTKPPLAFCHLSKFLALINLLICSLVCLSLYCSWHS
jgi:hypothetical protein